MAPLGCRAEPVCDEREEQTPRPRRLAMLSAGAHSQRTGGRGQRLAEAVPVSASEGKDSDNEINMAMIFYEVMSSGRFLIRTSEYKSLPRLKLRSRLLNFYNKLLSLTREPPEQKI